MTTSPYQHPAVELDDEYRAAVARLDADLQIVARAAGQAGDDTLAMLAFLRKRVVAAYRTALADAAGSPYDMAWRLLELTVAAFIARVPSGLALEARAAAQRLRALTTEE
jgi:hypothetical protein